MAQWMGQFSGNTHETKIQDKEKSLRHALKTFSVASDSEKQIKIKNVLNLANSLLNARLKALDAKINKLGVSKTNNGPLRKSQLFVKQQNLKANGVLGILREFGFEGDITL